LGAIGLRLGAELYFYYTYLGSSLTPAVMREALSSLAFLNSLPLAFGMLVTTRDASLEARLRLLPLKRTHKDAVLALAAGIGALGPLLCGLALPLANAIPLLAVSAGAFLRSALLLPLALVAAAAFVRACAGLLGTALSLRRPRGLSQARNIALSLAFLALALLSPRLSLYDDEARVLLTTGASFSLEALGLSGILGMDAPLVALVALVALIAALSLAALSLSRAGALASRAKASAKANRTAPERGMLGGHLALMPIFSPRGELGWQLALIASAALIAWTQKAPPAVTLILALALILREALRALAFLASDTPSLRRVLYLASPQRGQGLAMIAASALALVKASPLLLCALLGALLSDIV